MSRGKYLNVTAELFCSMTALANFQMKYRCKRLLPTVNGTGEKL